MKAVLGLKLDPWHDTGAAIVLDNGSGLRVVAIAQERLDRVKNSRAFPAEAIAYCLDVAGCRLTDLSLVVSDYIFEPTIGDTFKDGPAPAAAKVEFFQQLKKFGIPFVFAEHHLCHAASAYFATDWDDAAALVIDGHGSHYETQTLFSCRGNGITKVTTSHRPGIGWMYSVVTEAILGFGHLQEGKAMGLAGWAKGGGPRDKEFRGISNPTNPCELVYSQFALEERVWKYTTPAGFSQRKPDQDPVGAPYAEIAFAAQAELESGVMKLVHQAAETVASKRLCYSGGVALNIPANRLILDSGLYNEFFIQPAASDSGIPLGAALLGYHTMLGGQRRWVMKHAFIGRQYTATENLDALKQWNGPRADYSAETLAKVLANDYLAAWCQGSAEYGPRALGHRSILCLPRHPQMKAYLNQEVKHREMFRPFAPIVPIEHQAEYFDLGVPSPFMLINAGVHADKAALMPGILHADGTARVQSICREEQPELHALLIEVGRQTGVPVLLNTSLNLAGEPIVETPADVVELFMRSRLDALVVGSQLLTKIPLQEMLEKSNPGLSTMTAAGPTDATAFEIKPLVANLARFFGSPSVCQVDWTSAEAVQLRQFQANGDQVKSQALVVTANEPHLPLADGESETVFTIASIAQLSPQVLPVWLAELRRVTGKNLWMSAEVSPGRDRIWWERQFIEAGFRKHPLSLSIVSFEALDQEGEQLTLVFEKVPPAALALYPLSVLKAERDLHMDMSREAGPRSEAHLARYQMAAQQAPNQGIIVDAACGLGYGSALLARLHPEARVIGIDNSAYAVKYATENFACTLPNLEFHRADVCDFGFLGGRKLDYLVSFETIEHIPDPARFLKCAGEHMNPGAGFIGSIPNLWVDETGKDPSPYHLHVFDYERFHALVATHWKSINACRQNADHGVKGHHGRILRSLAGRPPSQADREQAEWWIIAAHSPAMQSSSPTESSMTINTEIRDFVLQLSQFLQTRDLLQVECESPSVLKLTRFGVDPFSAEPQSLEYAGGAPHLPLADGSCDTVFNFALLAALKEEALAAWLAEFHRIIGRNLWVVLPATPDRNRAWWQDRFARAGFGIHPLMATLGTVEDPAETTTTLVLQKTSISAGGFHPLTKIEKDQWQQRAQEGEFSFHKKNQWRQTPEFVTQTASLFQYFGLDAADFRGKTVIDLGAGSKLRSKYFTDVSLIAIEPLADRFLQEIPWCDLRQASEVYSVPAEEPIEKCKGRADLLVSINVLDHCYNFEKAIQNIRDYLRDDGLALLSFDKHETADEMHPLALNEATCEAVFKAKGLAVDKFTTGMGSNPTYGHGPYCMNYWLRKLPVAPSTPDVKPGTSSLMPPGRVWLLCSNSNHVKLFAPVFKELQQRGWKPTFVSLDNYYGQGATKALRDLGLERLELPTRTPDGNWHERAPEKRQPWNEEAAETIQKMLGANAPHLLVVGNDIGCLEQLFVKAARDFSVRTVLVQEGALRSPSLDSETGERTTVMGDGGCDLICTWGEAWANRLRARGVGGLIEAVGNPLFDLSLPARTTRTGPSKTILLIGQCFGKYNEYTLEQEHAVYEQLINAVVQRRRHRLVFKLHPQQDPAYYTQLHRRLGHSFELMLTGESLASIQSADLVVSVASTMALEAYRLGVPAVTLHYLAPFEVPDLVRLPGGCQSEGEFYRFLDDPESWPGLRSELETNEAVTRDLFFKMDGKACERMVASFGKLEGNSSRVLPVRPKPALHIQREGPGWNLLNELYATKKAPDLSGKVRDLELAGVSLETGHALYDLIRAYRPRKTLETGFAYGFSTLFILQALWDNSNGTHEAIDPVETDRWHGIGLANVKRAGFDRIFKHIERPSQLVLPERVGKEFNLDFAFIDGSHLFDETLLDFYYVDRLLTDGGIIVLDDYDWMPAVRTVANFIETNLSYEVLPTKAPKVRVFRKIQARPRAWDHFVPFAVPSTEDLKAKLAPALVEKPGSRTYPNGSLAIV